MADLVKQQFRATNGLDAAGEKVINVAKANRTVLTDAVNVAFFIEENTIQTYDSTRGYIQNFAVMYDGRIWVSNRAITSPAGTFVQDYWTAVRTDAKYEFINTSGKQLKSGDFISADSSSSDLTFTLPNSPNEGDSIVIRDIGGNVGYKSINIVASNQRIAFNQHQLTSLGLTNPYSQILFVFSNRLWQTFITPRETFGRLTPNSEGTYSAQAGDAIFARYTTSGPLEVILPKYANTGDYIQFIDTENKEPINHLIVSTFDDTTSVDTQGTKEKEYRTSGKSVFIYDAVDKLWRYWTADIRDRIRIIRDDVTMNPNESVMVWGTNNSTIKTINIKLPTSIAPGDKARVAMNYMRKGQTVVITPSGTDTIATNKTMMQFPRRSEYPPETAWVQVTSLTFNGTTDYVPIVEFSYVEDTSGTNFWVVSDVSPRVERVDASNPDRLGVIALATQDQANVDKGSTPATELAITPSTLANRTATEARQGIAAIATTALVNQDSTASYNDLTIVTPKKLNERTATETRRGLAEIATQAEVTTGTDDTTIVTPLKLATRRATETLAGLAPIVVSGGNKPALKNTPGTGVYDYTDNSSIVTPKALREIKASVVAQGTIFLATDTDVIEAPAYDAVYPLAVSPSALHKKTATESRIGFTQTATQAEITIGTDDFKYVTPLKLATRKATETLDGIIRVGTSSEYAAGTLDNVVVTPLKLKTFLTGARTTVNTTSGLVQTGNIWDGISLNIQQATDTQRGTARIATQDEIDKGVDDTTFVTPKRLQLKKATETTEGSIRFATAAEVTTGIADMLAVSPKNLKYVIQQESTWDASVSLRGPVKLSEKAITWSGNATSGSTVDLETYVKSGYAISPYEFNRVLGNYLPRLAQAADSLLLAGVASTNWVRRDIDQTINGALTLTKATTVQAPLTSTSTGKFSSLNLDTSATVGNGSGSAVINLNAKSNAWTLTAGDSLSALVLSTGSINPVIVSNAGDMTVLQSLTTGNLVSATKGVVVNALPAITPENGGMTFGNTTSPVVVKSSNASTIVATDSSGSYNFVTKKNYLTELGTDFVRKNVADTVTGQLTFTKARKDTIDSTINAAYINSTEGNFNVEVTTAAVYNNLPGYVVPTYDTSSATPVIVSYTQVNAPGTLSQFGTSANGKYQIWAPRPTAAGENVVAQTFWIRNWNTVTAAWDSWARMYTSATPPTASDIGAVPVTGSTFDNLTVRDYLKIGNVIMRPDPNTRTVTFEWVD
ncbi:tail fiber protein proximal subunit [Erwinia phage Cronus]|uniref:Long tail fiber proximal subunit n=1 Tax=Erwinia phage Cronus TaxID=2163633 RepID=A0A2S1GM47_9CAUD|nr:tail fiber protein proximal subunit [Erwinia phage Cronus]AWD90413.1 long tail fiber proximal subunit [Erwinia phage Cronus]